MSCNDSIFSDQISLRFHLGQQLVVETFSIKFDLLHNGAFQAHMSKLDRNQQTLGLLAVAGLQSLNW